MGKGLCLSCSHDSGCVFARRFPVLLCEEFSTQGSKSEKSRKKSKGKTCAHK